jgi:hypothetical protein
MPKKNIHYLEEEMLAAHLCGKTEDDERDDIEDAFCKKFDITLEQFENIMEALWPMLAFGISPLTETAFVGFADEKENGWIIKKDISKHFVNGVVHWMGGFDIKKAGGKMARSITKGGEAEFDITITKL